MNEADASDGSASMTATREIQSTGRRAQLEHLREIMSTGVAALVRWPKTTAILLVLLAVVVANENILFRGQTLVASANAHPFDNRADRLRPTDLRGNPSVNWHDLGGVWWQWEPAARFFAIAYRKGIIPLWDPTIAGGVDAHVNVTQGQYFPPYVLLLLLGDQPVARDLYYLLLIWMSGAACALLALRNGLHVISAAAIGVLYALSGSMTQTANSIIGQSFAMIPVLVLACDWFLDSPNLRRTALFAAVVAVGVTTSFMPAVISGLFVLPFLVTSSVLSPVTGWIDRNAWRIIAMFSLGIALGLGSVAFILIPLHLASASLPGFQSWYVGSGLHRYEWPMLLTLVSPGVAYDVWQQPNTLKHLFPHPGAAFFYVGVVPLLLMPFIRQPRNPSEKKLLGFFLSVTVVLFLKFMGVPPVQWLGKLPVLNTLHFTPYFCASFTLAIAGLAGMGVEGIIRYGTGRARHEAALLLTVAFFLALTVFASLAPRNENPNWRVNLIELARILFIVIVFFRVIGASIDNRITRVTAAALLFGLIVLELGTLAHRGRYERADVWSNVPLYVRYLQRDRDLFRLHSTDVLALTPNVNQGEGLSGISSRHVFVPARYTKLLRRYFSTAETPYPVAQSLLPTPRRVLDLLNVKYVIATTEAEQAALAENGLTEVLTDGAFHVFYNVTVWPRAYIATRWRVIRSPDEALEAVGELDKPDSVVLEKNPAEISPIAAAFSRGSVRAVHYSYNFAEFAVRTNSPALFVLLDNNSAGWRARVNGGPAEVLNANFAFRAVAVPAGQSTVTFEYVTPGLGWALMISALSVAAIIAMALLRGRRTPLPNNR